MTKSLRIVLAVVAIAASGAAYSTPISLGSMGPPGLAVFGNSFSSVGDFSDEYTFSLLGSADSFGFTLEFDASLRRDIDILSVGLSSDGTLASALWATDWSAFSFNNLAAGAYSLFVNGVVTGRDGGLLGGGLVGYGGTLITAKSVPEPGTLGLFGMSLLGLYFAMNRRRVR